MNPPEHAVDSDAPAQSHDDHLTWTVTRIVPERDLDEVVDVLDTCFVNPWTREMLERELQQSDVSRIFVLREEVQGLLGFCACWAVGDELHINNLAIRHDARRRGAATWLLRTVLAEAADSGLRRATLEVRESNDRARRLYARLGFAIGGTRPGYYRSPDENALILWHDDLGTFAVREAWPGDGSVAIDRATDGDSDGLGRS
jgi:ribosomal-protein-alanine N-acetyltransferase